jgi:hypothetical protein
MMSGHKITPSSSKMQMQVQINSFSDIPWYPLSDRLIPLIFVFKVMFLFNEQKMCWLNKTE